MTSWLKTEDVVRILSSSGMPMTSESWSELSAHAAIVAAQLRELEGKSKPVFSTETSMLPTDQAQIQNRDFGGIHPIGTRILTDLADTRLSIITQVLPSHNVVCLCDVSMW
jgi:hypothetical protein